MSNVLDILMTVLFATACSLLARSMTKKGKLSKWWFGLAIVPLLCWGMALAIMLFPRAIPEGWQEGDFDTGRADFVALVLFAVVLPSAYLAFALPTALLVRLWKSRRAKV